MSQNCNIFQTVFKIGQDVDLMTYKPKKAEEIEKDLAAVLPGLLGKIDTGFKVAWGPAVFTSEESSTTSVAWTIVDNASIEFEDHEYHPIVVVPIGSTSGWAPDGDVEALKIPPKPIKNGPGLLHNSNYIAYGYAKLLHDIITATVQEEPNAFLVALYAILRNYTDARVVFVGHGMSGTLACLLALTLVKVGVFSKYPQDKILTYSTASPSPGNLTFAKTFETVFPPPQGPLEGYKHWNVNIVNPFDIVPYGYCMDSEYTPFVLGSVPTIYGAPALETVQSVVSNIEAHANSLYYPVKASTFESPIPKPTNTPGSDEEFIGAALEQHEDAFKRYILGDNSYAM
ncbi:Lipase (class 3) [Ceratobasidium sp. AG-Ba]|nr:Lipase (class 3) [Ceratobasidium sp. AG-Ba]QRW11152.1 Lipase (class 3) [Ceratobasidium sp. AG-Ba]